MTVIADGKGIAPLEIRLAVVRVNYHSQRIYDAAWMELGWRRAAKEGQSSRIWGRLFTLEHDKRTYLRGLSQALTEYRRAVRDNSPGMGRRAVNRVGEQRHRRYWQNQRQTYGLSKIQWLALYHRQGGKCAICKTNFFDIATPQLIYGAVTDHCHKTGAVRGLLCTGCNSLISGYDGGKLPSVPVRGGGVSAKGWKAFAALEKGASEKTVAKRFRLTLDGVKRIYNRAVQHKWQMAREYLRKSATP